MKRPGRPVGMKRIFAGKKAFHKSMANLPIEKKLDIVAALQRIDYSIKPAKWKKRMMWKGYPPRPADFFSAA